MKTKDYQDPPIGSQVPMVFPNATRVRISNSNNRWPNYARRGQSPENRLARFSDSRSRWVRSGRDVTRRPPKPRSTTPQPLRKLCCAHSEFELRPTVLPIYELLTYNTFSTLSCCCVGRGWMKRLSGSFLIVCVNFVLFGDCIVNVFVSVCEATDIDRILLRDGFRIWVRHVPNVLIVSVWVG